MKKRANSGYATNAKMTDEQKHERAMKGVEARKARANLPKATHIGVLHIGDNQLDVAVLDNGLRIIKQQAVFDALNRPIKPPQNDGGSISL